MSYELYRYIFIGGLVLSIVMLIATVLIFFLLNIKAAIGDITGSSKRKAIENIHNKNITTDSNKKVATKFNYENQTTSARLAAESVETAKISPQDRYDSLEASETTTLNTPTTSETTVLSAEPENTPPPQPILVYEEASNPSADFSIEVDITYVHSNEVVR